MANWPGDCNCAMTYTLSVVGGKWKWLILYRLADNKVLRYGELKKLLPSITHKMLSNQLKELELEQLIHRKEYHQIPPRVEYSLTGKGQTLMPILDLMRKWGTENRPAGQPAGEQNELW
jgi:DNA-binding HxlR family transcriptional regulator